MALVLIAGATQSGKGEIAGKLQQRGFERIATHTDGQPTENTPYIHVSQDEMANMLDDGLFIEYKRHAGAAHGLTKKSLVAALDSDCDQVIILSPGGVAKIRKYLHANNVPHLALFLSIPTITSVERLTDKLKKNSLSSDQFVHKMATLAQEERDWSREAYTGNTFDIVFEIAEGHDLNEVANSIATHVRSLNAQRKRMAK